LRRLRCAMSWRQQQQKPGDRQPGDQSPNQVSQASN
jgi:hypothetical protein